MANISEKVEQIRKAIYGKDVRESIASGIEAINDHVETTVAAEETREANEAERIANYSAIITEYENFNEEVEQARESLAKEKEFDTLGARLEESEQDLANHETAADPHDQYALDTDLATLESALEGHELDDTAHGIGAIAQAVDNLEQEVSSHMAETVSELIMTRRDLQLEGIQVVSLPRKPKRVEIYATIVGAKKWSLGTVVEDGVQGCMFSMEDGITEGFAGRTILLREGAAANLTYGKATLNDSGVEIDWNIIGSGATGTATVRIVAHYHGGD